MAHAEKTVLINRPVRSIYYFVLNAANNKLWQSQVLYVKAKSEPPYGTGSQFELGLNRAGGKVLADYRITESKRDELIEFLMIAGPDRRTGAYRFQGQETGTEVTLELDSESYEPPALTKPGAIEQALRVIRGADTEAELSRFPQLSTQEKKVLQMLLQGKTEQDIARSSFVGEGTARNYVSSALSRALDATVQQSMEDEVATLDELKAFLEKHV